MIEIPESPLKQKVEHLKALKDCLPSPKTLRKVLEELQVIDQTVCKPTPSTISAAIKNINTKLLLQGKIKQLIDFEQYLYSIFMQQDSIQLVFEILLKLLHQHHDLFTSVVLVHVLLNRSNEYGNELKTRLVPILQMFEDNSEQIHLEIISDIRQTDETSVIIPYLACIDSQQVVKECCGGHFENVKADEFVMDWLLTRVYDPSHHLELPFTVPVPVSDTSTVPVLDTTLDTSTDLELTSTLDTTLHTSIKEQTIHTSIKEHTSKEQEYTSKEEELKKRFKSLFIK
jgi:hypothetical protein